MLEFLPIEGGMLETLLFLYGISVIVGSWLMLNGIAEAPLGYEDEDGFHYTPIPALVKFPTEQQVEREAAE